MAEAGKLVTPRTKVPEHMESPRDLESTGKEGPSDWGKGGTHFKVGKNSAGAGTGVKSGCGVDLETGRAHY